VKIYFALCLYNAPNSMWCVWDYLNRNETGCRISDDHPTAATSNLPPPPPLPLSVSHVNTTSDYRMRWCVNFGQCPVIQASQSGLNRTDIRVTCSVVNGCNILSVAYGQGWRKFYGLDDTCDLLRRSSVPL